MTKRTPLFSWVWFKIKYLGDHRFDFSFSISHPLIGKWKKTSGCGGCRLHHCNGPQLIHSSLIGRTSWRSTPNYWVHVWKKSSMLFPLISQLSWVFHHVRVWGLHRKMSYFVLVVMSQLSKEGGAYCGGIHVIHMTSSFGCFGTRGVSINRGSPKWMVYSGKTY